MQTECRQGNLCVIVHGNGRSENKLKMARINVFIFNTSQNLIFTLAGRTLSSHDLIGTGVTLELFQKGHTGLEKKGQQMSDIQGATQGAKH